MGAGGGEKQQHLAFEKFQPSFSSASFYLMTSSSAATRRFIQLAEYTHTKIKINKNLEAFMFII